ncbi:glycosyltransferase family 2 protein [Polaribacter staleyi]|uniref:glycosyltransferase family 2 protein n=1 Tax=Polaribacter staleyi TaxID=2022337 RepID=UPI0031BB2A24
MKISIITVCYNSESTIEKTFQSVKNQKYKNIEYIVVDGRSTDGTLSLINKYNNVISKFVSEPDKGLYDAMNKGVKMATGELIGILNSDDIFYNDNVIEEVVKYHKRNNLDASVSDVVYTDVNGKIVRKYSAKKWLPEKLRIGFMPPHAGIFIKKEIFQKFGNYQLDFVIGADYELITRFFLSNNISWKYLNITTTSMLIGGISSSGVSSYKLISKEIKRALTRNNIKFSYLRVQLRGLWKIIGLLIK